MFFLSGLKFGIENDPKNEPKTIQKLSKNDQKTIKNNLKMIQKRSKNYLKTIQNDTNTNQKRSKRMWCNNRFSI